MQHYKGMLVEFDFSPNDYKIVKVGPNDTLHYIGDETDGSKITIPEGMTSYYGMFYKTKIVTPPIIPSGPASAENMFK